MPENKTTTTTITLPGGVDVTVPTVPGISGGGITIPGVGSALTEDEARRREEAAFTRGKESMTVIIGGAAVVGALAGYLLSR